MNCEHIKELLSAYLDNVLTPEESQAVTNHVHDCLDCNLILADFRRFDALLSFMPRISPHKDLQNHIFSSAAFLELTETFDSTQKIERVYSASTNDAHDLPDFLDRPRLVALPGGRYCSPNAIPTVKTPSVKHGHFSLRWGLLAMQVAIAVVLLFTLGLGSFTGWNLWHQQQKTTNTGAILPPEGLPIESPLATGIRFVFLRDGALWSAPSEGSGQPVRLTASTVTVASN
ncbi:MAG: zf-HC2 domain-containing protein, partial [Chloroflexota bacterium]|nr:zf-HC2 domain-containing protein [Chloroflexota bacterium]